eukprot:5208316-Amphidinium_carterae.1
MTGPDWIVVDVSPVVIEEGPDEESPVREVECQNLQAVQEVGVESRTRATETMDVNPIIVDDQKISDTPIAEVTTDGHYEVEAMLDSGAGAS